MRGACWASPVLELARESREGALIWAQLPWESVIIIMIFKWLQGHRINQIYWTERVSGCLPGDSSNTCNISASVSIHHRGRAHAHITKPAAAISLWNEKNFLCLCMRSLLWLIHLYRREWMRDELCRQKGELAIYLWFCLHLVLFWGCWHISIPKHTHPQFSALLGIFKMLCEGEPELYYQISCGATK